MSREGSEEPSSVAVDSLESMNLLTIADETPSRVTSQCASSDDSLVWDDGSGIRVACFSEIVDDVTLHFQIISLQKQVYAWIGCNSARFGHLYAAAPTRPDNTVGVTSLIGGTSDNTGSGIARRLVLKIGVPIVLACNIPKSNPMLEANAERKLMEKLISLGYTRKKSHYSQGSSS